MPILAFAGLITSILFMFPVLPIFTILFQMFTPSTLLFARIIVTIEFAPGAFLLCIKNHFNLLTTLASRPPGTIWSGSVRC
jgi:hypothetical protein